MVVGGWWFQGCKLLAMVDECVIYIYMEVPPTEVLRANTRYSNGNRLKLVL